MSDGYRALSREAREVPWCGGLGHSSSLPHAQTTWQVFSHQQDNTGPWTALRLFLQHSSAPAHLLNPKALAPPVLASNWVAASLASLPVLRVTKEMPNCPVPCGGFAGHTGVAATLGRLQQVCSPEQLLNKSPQVISRPARTTGSLLMSPTYLLMIHLTTCPSLFVFWGMSCDLHFYSNHFPFPFPHT